MAAEAQPRHHEEIEPEEGGRLTRARLDRSKITEQGGKVMNGRATLVCIPALGTEGEKCFKVDMSDNLIVPNPDQPREYFNPEEMADLRKTIAKTGQAQPISVVPIVLEDGSRKIFIIDGERRFRIIRELGLPTIKVIVAWTPTEKKILYKSLSLNIARADHNPIELAKAFKRAIDLERQEESPLSRQEIADEIGISLGTLSKYLEYLEYLTPELQEMMQKGTLTVSAADGIIRRKKEHGDKLDLGEVAKDVATTRGLADAVVSMAVSRALEKKGYKTDAVRGEVRSAISKLDSSLVSGCNAADVILSADVAVVLECLFERADSSRPPDVMRDKIGNLHGRLARMMEIIEQAIELPALQKVPGKPDFAKYIQKKEQSFGHHIRLEIAKTLARAADEHGEFMTGGELIRAAGIAAKDFSNNIRLLKVELPKIGIELQECILRRKDSRGIYAKVNAYRLAWLTEQRQAVDTSESDASASDKGPRRMSDEQRVAAIRAAQEKRAATAAQADRGVQLKDLEIACKTSTEDPNLLSATEAVAQNIQKVGYSYTVHGGTEFGQRLGVKIEVIRRGGEKVYVVKSNVRGFALNFKLSTRIFSDLIADALHVEKNTVTVDVQDL